MDVKLPVADAALVVTGITSDVVHGIFRFDVCAALAEYHGDLAFEVELVGRFWYQQGLLVTHLSLGMPMKQDRVFADGTAGLACVSQVVHGNANYFSCVWDQWQELNLLNWKISRSPVSHVSRP
jgi:hypothetical protein